MSTVKTDKKFTVEEVNEIIRKRLARSGGRILKAPEDKATLTVHTASGKTFRYQPEVRSVDDALEFARNYMEVPEHSLDRFLKGATEALDELTDHIAAYSEKRALSESEQRALDDMTETSDKLRISIDEAEKRMNVMLKPVEDRAITPEREEEIIISFAFKPDQEREQIRNAVIKSQEQRDPVYNVLRSVFMR